MSVFLLEEELISDLDLNTPDSEETDDDIPNDKITLRIELDQEFCASPDSLKVSLNSFETIKVLGKGS